LFFFLLEKQNIERTNLVVFFGFFFMVPLSWSSFYF